MTQEFRRRALAAMMTLSLSAAVVSAKQIHQVVQIDAARAQEARATLKEMKLLASDASADAQRLRSMIQNGEFSPYSHRTQLTNLQERINQMGRDVVRLEAQRDSLPSWEQHAIDQVLPLVQDAAANARKAIAYFNDNQTRLALPANEQLAAGLVQDTEQLSAMIGKFLKYEDLRDRESHLENQIAAHGN